MMKSCLIVAFSAAVSLACAGGAEGEDTWASPRTTRRYLHSPLSERLCVMWADGKVTLSDVRHEHVWRKRPHGEEEADAFWLLHGEDGHPFDFKTVRHTTAASGVPICGLVWREGALETTLECCCDYDSRPDCHAKLTVRNVGDALAGDRYVIRSGRGLERELLGFHPAEGQWCAPDFYVCYDSFPEAWSNLTASSFPVAFARDPKGLDAADGRMSFRVELAPGESQSWTWSFGSKRARDYETVRAATSAAWEEELTRRLSRVPQFVMNDSCKRALMRDLLCQVLQCYNRCVNGEAVLPRQGCLQRWVWPWENYDVLELFGRLGTCRDLASAAFDLYFVEYGRNEEGLIGPFGNNWACNTACVIGSLARYCLETGDCELWNRYYPRAMKAVRWIQGTRQLSKEMKGCVPGLFPPMQSSDWSEKGQFWAMTDLMNLRGLGDFLAASERFGAPDVQECRVAYSGYVRDFKKAFERWRQEAADKEQFWIPVVPDGNEDKWIRGGYFRAHYGIFAEAGLKLGFLSEDDVMRVWLWCVDRGIVDPHHGLCANFPHRSGLHKGDRHFWYTTAFDRPWYNAFRLMGRTELADKILEGQLKYSMSAEHVVGERYCDADPWYFPWSPNASGAARIGLMLQNDDPVRVKPDRRGAVWHPGETLSWRYRFSYPEIGARARWRVTDAYGEELARGDVPDTALDGCDHRLELSERDLQGRFGAFTLELSIETAAGRDVAVTHFALLTSAASLPCTWAGTGCKKTYGYRWGDYFYLDLVREAGLGVVRSGIWWPDWEKSKGVYAPDPELERYHEEAYRRGLRVNCILSGRSKLYEDEIDPDAFARFAVYLAKRWQGKPCRFELWNEPENFHWRSVYGNEKWYGKWRMFTRHVAEAVKGVSPDMRVGVLSEDKDWRLKGMIEDGCVGTGETVMFHPYSHRNPRPEYGYFFRDGGKTLRQLIDVHAPGAGYAITESGWTTFHGGDAFNAVAGCYPSMTPAQQALYLLRMFVMARTYGCEYALQYDFIDDGPRRGYTEHNFGLLYDDFTPKPSFAAVAFMTRFIGHAKSEGELSDCLDAYRACRFGLPDGRMAIVAWAVNGCREVEFPKTIGRPIGAYDMYGNAVMPPISKAGRIHLGERPLYLIFN